MEICVLRALLIFGQYVLPSLVNIALKHSEEEKELGTPGAPSTHTHRQVHTQSFTPLLDPLIPSLH